MALEITTDRLEIEKSVLDLYYHPAYIFPMTAADLQTVHRNGTYCMAISSQGRLDEHPVRELTAFISALSLQEIRFCLVLLICNPASDPERLRETGASLRDFFDPKRFNEPLIELVKAPKMPLREVTVKVLLSRKKSAAESAEDAAIDALLTEYIETKYRSGETLPDLSDSNLQPK